jgi:hypothetical protein
VSFAASVQDDDARDAAGLDLGGVGCLLSAFCRFASAFAR